MRSEAMTLMEQRGVPIEEAGRALDQPLDEVLDSLGSTDERAWSSRSDLWTVCRHEPEFPAPLAHFRRESDVPLVIFGVGRKAVFDSLTSQKALAMVGARRASAYGREVAYSLAGDACEQGLTIVSGMALGIDGAAHRGALQVGGATIAVLAGGPDRPYPRSHRLLYEQIVESGCVISENPPGVEARRWAFVARNRIIAGVSAMTVWVEGAETSGARHTFDFAEELGLPVGVVPGPVNSPTSAGPNARLAGEGVVPVLGIDQVLTELAIEPIQKPLPGVDIADHGLAAEVMALIAVGERTPRGIAESLPGRTPREITQALGQLELSGALVREPSGEYRRAR